MARALGLLLLSSLIALVPAAAQPPARAVANPDAACAAPPADTDGDGILDVEEDVGQNGDCDDDDSDFDSVADYLDEDDDGDGIPTLIEGPADTDADSTPDYLDLDSEDDSVEDATEGDDRNRDGVVDHAPSGMDGDGDGLDAAYDPDEGGIPKALQDNDCDGLIDVLDTDDDDDGQLTLDEGTVDTDLDGVPDYLDSLDDDPTTLFVEGFESGSFVGWCRVVATLGQ